MRSLTFDPFKTLKTFKRFELLEKCIPCGANKLAVASRLALATTTPLPKVGRSQRNCAGRFMQNIKALLLLLIVSAADWILASDAMECFLLVESWYLWLVEYYAIEIAVDRISNEHFRLLFFSALLSQEG